METLVEARRHERRRARRCQAVEEHGIVSARVKPGHEAVVIDISADGALVETFHRLLPGATVVLQLEGTARRLVIRGRVIRCSVVAVRASAIVYRGAIAFERSIGWLAEASLDGNQVPMAPGCRPPDGREEATREATLK